MSSVSNDTETKNDPTMDRPRSNFYYPCTFLSPVFAYTRNIHFPKLSLVERMFLLPDLLEQFSGFFGDSEEILKFLRVNHQLHDTVIQNLPILSVTSDVFTTIKEPFPMLRELNILPSPETPRNYYRRRKCIDSFTIINIPLERFPRLKVLKCKERFLNKLHVDRSIQLTRLYLSYGKELKSLNFCPNEVDETLKTLLKGCKELVHLKLEHSITYSFLLTLLSYCTSISLQSLHIAAVLISDETPRSTSICLPQTLKDCVIKIYSKCVKECQYELVYGEELTKLHLYSSVDNLCVRYNPSNSSLQDSSLKDVKISGSDVFSQRVWESLSSDSVQLNQLQFLHLEGHAVSTKPPKPLIVTGLPNLVSLSCSCGLISNELIVQNLPKLENFKIIRMAFEPLSPDSRMRFSNLPCLKTLSLCNVCELVVEDVPFLEELRATTTFDILRVYLRRLYSLKKLCLLLQTFRYNTFHLEAVSCNCIKKLLCTLPSSFESTQQFISLLKEANTIEKISLYGQETSKKDTLLILDAIRAHSTIRILNIDVFSDKYHLSLADGFENLEELNLTQSKVNHYSTIDIQRLPRLSKLCVSKPDERVETKLKTKVILRSLPLLSQLSCRMKDAILEDLPSLRTFVSPHEMNSFTAKRMSSLSALDVRASHVHISDMPNLRWSTFDSTSQEEEKKIELLNLPMLMELTVFHLDAFGPNFIIRGCPNLNKLTCDMILSSERVNACATSLLQWEKMNILVISEQNDKMEPVKEKSNKAIKEIKDMEENNENKENKEIKENKENSDDAMKDEIILEPVPYLLHHLSLHPSLQSLTLRQFTSGTITLTSGFSELQEFHLSVCQAELVQIQNIQKLNSVTISRFRPLKQESWENFPSTFRCSTSSIIPTTPSIILNSLPLLSELSLHHYYDTCRISVQACDLPSLTKVELCEISGAVYDVLLFGDWTFRKFSISSNINVWTSEPLDFEIEDEPKRKKQRTK